MNMTLNSENSILGVALVVRGTRTRPDYLVNRVPKKLRGHPGKKLLKNREIHVK